MNSKTAFSMLSANVDTYEKDTARNWKIEIENCKHDPMGEDLFADIGMRKNGVTGTEVQISHSLSTVKV